MSTRVCSELRILQKSFLSAMAVRCLSVVRDECRSKQTFRRRVDGVLEVRRLAAEMTQ